jgi:3-hydroxyacyl-CoA dehydrogenase
MALVAANLADNLDDGDPGLAYARFPEVEQRMLERGQLGRKAGGGFGRMTKHPDGSRDVETFDLTTEEWRPAVEPDLDGVPGDLGQVLFTDTPQGRLAWEIFGGGLRYAADLVPEISDDIVNIDRAMRWGFNWAKGPFELLDTIGPGRFVERIRAEGADLPKMLQVMVDAGADGFYRGDGDGGTQFLTVDGAWSSLG